MYRSCCIFYLADRERLHIKGHKAQSNNMFEYADIDEYEYEPSLRKDCKFASCSVA